MNEKKFTLLNAVVSFLAAGTGVAAFIGLIWQPPLFEAQTIQQDHFNAPVFVPISVQKSSIIDVVAVASRRVHLAENSPGAENGTGVTISIKIDDQICKVHDGEDGRSELLPRTYKDGFKLITVTAKCLQQPLERGHHFIKIDAEATGSCDSGGSSNALACGVNLIRGSYTLMEK